MMKGLVYLRSISNIGRLERERDVPCVVGSRQGNLKRMLKSYEKGFEGINEKVKESCNIGNL